MRLRNQKAITIHKDGLPDDSKQQGGVGHGPAMPLSQRKGKARGLLALLPGPRRSLSLASVDLCKPVTVMDRLPPSHRGQAPSPHSVSHGGRIGQATIPVTKGLSSYMVFCF